MIERFKHVFRDSVLYDHLLRFRRHRDLIRWINSGKMGLTPHLIKQATIRDYARTFQIQLFIESGTYFGEMVAAMQNSFSEIISIELAEPLYKRAMKKFHRYPHIALWQGDSSQVFSKVFSGVREPALFWLDGHYSAGISAKGEICTPILRELEFIFNHHIQGHVILIDDARCFTGQNDYPRLDVLKRLISERRSGYIFDVREDIIRIHPKIEATPNGVDQA